MGVREIFESLLRTGKPKGKPSSDPVSIVLLLQEPHFPTLDQLREFAGRAYGTNFSEDRSSRHSIYVRNVTLTLANVGSHSLSFLFMITPYGDDSEGARNFEKKLPRADQRQVWATHKAYMAIDYVKGDIDEDSKYVVLAKLCAKFCDGNCLGLYLPKENTLVPGRENASKQLSKIIAHREVDVA